MLDFESVSACILFIHSCRLSSSYAALRKMMSNPKGKTEEERNLSRGVSKQPSPFAEVPSKSEMQMQRGKEAQANEDQNSTPPKCQSQSSVQLDNLHHLLLSLSLPNTIH
jgi:hypothetical protein